MNTPIRIALLLLLSVGAGKQAWPDVVVPIESVASFVNVRLAPDASSEIVGRLQQGSQLRYVRTVDGWYEVELEGGGTGFVSAEWSKLVPDSEDHVAAESPPDVAAEAADAASAAESAVEPAPPADESPVAPTVATNLPPQPEPPPAADMTPVEPAVAAGAVDYLAKFSTASRIGQSQVFDNGRNVGIGTSEPQQRLEVNGNIQINERNSGVAGLLITQSDGDTGYIMHSRDNTLSLGAGSVDRLTITGQGNVGFSVHRPAHPIDVANGAHLSAGGVWTNSSSIAKKENVRELEPEEALQALASLEPVRFNYKAEQNEEYLGFIAEQVPELVATADRNGLSTMDIVAVLTSVVKQQQQQIERLESRLDSQMTTD